LEIDVATSNAPLQIPLASISQATFLNNDDLQTLLPWLGCCAHIYFNQAETLDFTVVANRRLFVTAPPTYKYVSLGSDGSTPTGTAPIYYFRGAGESFKTNRGTGGTPANQGTNIANCTDGPPAS
jgi:hypothetical protein